jgi:hypothetical protein
MREELVDIVREEVNKYETEGINCYVIVDRILGVIKDRLVTDQATGAGDYSEAEEYADRILGR